MRASDIAKQQKDRRFSGTALNQVKKIKNENFVPLKFLAVHC